MGRYTFTDVLGYRFQQRPIRLLGSVSSLITIAFYLIAQMVGAGQLIKLLFGLDYNIAIVVVGVLMTTYVSFGGMLATTWVQIIKAILLLAGATVMAVLVMQRVGFSFDELFGRAVALHKDGEAIMTTGKMFKDPVSVVSLGLALMFGTAGLPHILMRFFTVRDAVEARKSVLIAVSLFAYFLVLILIIGYGTIVLVGTDQRFLGGRSVARRQQHGSSSRGAGRRWRPVPRVHIGGRFAPLGQWELD